MKVEKLNDNCWKIILHKEDDLNSREFPRELFCIIFNLVDIQNVKSISYFASKKSIDKMINLKDDAGEYLIASEHLYLVEDLQDNEVIVRFEPIKIYSLQEILK